MDQNHKNYKIYLQRTDERAESILGLIESLKLDPEMHIKFTRYEIPECTQKFYVLDSINYKLGELHIKQEVGDDGITIIPLEDIIHIYPSLCEKYWTFEIIHHVS